MPKWTNKGHKYDELGNYFKEHNEILISGKNINKITYIEKRPSFLFNPGVKINTEKFNYSTYKFSCLFGDKKTVIVPNEGEKILNYLIKIKNFGQIFA